MGKYLSFVETADALISKKGLDVQLVRRTSTSFNAVTQVETGKSVSYTFKAVCMPPSQQARRTVGTLEGKIAIECYFSAKGQTITPQPGDVITYQNAQWTIFWAQTYDPAGDGAIFTLAYAERGSQ